MFYRGELNTRYYRHPCLDCVRTMGLLSKRKTFVQWRHNVFVWSRSKTVVHKNTTHCKYIIGDTNILLHGMNITRCWEAHGRPDYAWRMAASQVVRRPLVCDVGDRDGVSCWACSDYRSLGQAASRTTPPSPADTMPKTRLLNFTACLLYCSRVGHHCHSFPSIMRQRCFIVGPASATLVQN